MKKIMIGLAVLSSVSAFAYQTGVTIAGRGDNGNILAYAETILGNKTGCYRAELIGATDEVENALQALKEWDVATMSVSQFESKCSFFVRSVKH